MKLALFAAAAILASLVLLRRAALERFLSLTAGLWVVAAFLDRVALVFGVELDLYMCVVTVCVLNAAILWAIVATADDVKWSASRAAIAALLFYLAAIPPMMRTPPDGDEPFYILMAESLARDGDLDLANQFRDLAHSVSARTDLRPQIGDVARIDGVVHSHQEPFLAFLLVPGYLIAKLPGILATMAIFGALLARSTVRLFEEEGIDDRTTRALFPLFAFGQPIVFYAIRVWPEVPAAFAFVEALRGIRARRPARWLAALLFLVVLKVRFVLVAVVLVARAIRKPRQLALAAAAIAIPLLAALAITAHTARELIPGNAMAMMRGLFGLLLDGQHGLAFQAPVYLFGIIALTRWRSTPPAFRIGMTAAALYIFYLVPRAEWHGGWSPPLRYITFLMPVLALGAAAMWERIDPGPIAVASAWTVALVAHGTAFPWRLFHIANGESVTGEMLSLLWRADFSRLFPSFIRVNTAAYVAAIVLGVILIAFRTGRLASPVVFAALLVAMFTFGQRPANRIEFEDAHVTHEGGDLYPYVWQVQRFLYRGGWIVRPGDALSFLARSGTNVLWYQGAGTLQVGNHAYVLPPTGNTYAAAVVSLDRGARTELKCLSGAVNLDRMDHE